MARDVEADVNIKDKSDGGLKSFLANLRKADDRVKSTQKGIDEAAKSTGKLGKTADENAKAFAQLSKELEISKKELGSLARAFAEADTAAERTDISKAVRKQQAEIRNLTKNRDILKDLLPNEGEAVKEAEKSGKAVGNKFIAGFSPQLASGLSEAMEGAGVAAGPVLVGAIAGALPLLGATISAAVIGAAGIGGVVGGVLLASKDSRVQAAFAGMKTRISNQLQDAAIPFISQTIGGIDDIESALDGIDFKGIFAEAATFVRPLARGIGAALDGLGGGLEKAVAGARPVIDAIATGVAGIGRTVGAIFAELSDNGVEAAVALDVAFGLVIGTLKVVGAVVNGLTEAFGFLAQIGVFGQSVQQQYFAVKAAQDIAAKSAKDGTPSITNFMQAIADSGSAAATSAPQVDALTTAIDNAATAGQSYYNSQTGVAQALADAKKAANGTSKAVKDHGDALSTSSQKGRENRTVLNDLAGKLTANYDAYVKVNGAGKGADAVANTNRANFIKAAAAFGLNATKAKELADKLGVLPANKNVHINTNADNAKDAIKGVQAKINALHGKSIAIAVSTNIASVKRKVDNTLARLGGGFDASDYFSTAGPGAGLQRSGGPSPVQVDNQTNVTVLLDGREIRAIARSEAQAEIARANYRQKVGRR